MHFCCLDAGFKHDIFCEITPDIQVKKRKAYLSISCEHILYSHVLLSLGFCKEDWFSDVGRAHVLKTALTKGWAAAKPMLENALIEQS